MQDWASNAFRRIALDTGALVALTGFHHAYGAWLYSTPWRMHVVYVAAPLLALQLALLHRGLRSERREVRTRLLRWVVASILLLLVAPLGLFEGAYNHTIKNVVYFTGGTQATVQWFPPPTYELPTDLLFEFTGVAQFPLALFVAWRLMRIVSGNVK
jgi:hypothetical protein